MSHELRDRRLTHGELVAMLGPAIGNERSTELVGEAARKLGYVDLRLSVDQSLGVLEQMSKTAGLVGIVSRLAGARIRAAIASETASDRRR